MNIFLFLKLLNTTEGRIKLLIRFIIVAVAVIVAVIVVENLILFLLSIIDNMIDYNKKEIKKKKKRDSNSGERYWEIDYYSWQKNKKRYLEQSFKIRNKLENGETIIETCEEQKIVHKWLSSGYKKSRYRKEFRVYSEYIEERNIINVDYVHGDKIGRDKIINYGEQQINNVQNKIPIDILNKLIDVSNNHKLTSEDSRYIKNTIKNIENNLLKEQDKETLIDVLNKYTGIVANISAIISFFSSLII